MNVGLCQPIEPDCGALGRCGPTGGWCEPADEPACQANAGAPVCYMPDHPTSRLYCGQPCADADGDGACDGVDNECNADGTRLTCDVIAPICEGDGVPEVREQCYTGACVTWAECGNVLPAPCVGNDDCPAEQWCRVTQNPEISLCVPFQMEGEHCGGRVLPFAENRCDPSLQCAAVNPLIADLPGICLVSCRGNADCPLAQYCAADEVCRADATCLDNADCNTDGNTYIHPLCVGEGVCGFDTGSGMCGWTCDGNMIEK